MTMILPDAPARTLASITTPDIRAAFLAAHDQWKANKHIRGAVLHRPDAERATPQDWVDAALMDARHYAFFGGRSQGLRRPYLATPDYARDVGVEEEAVRYGIPYADDLFTLLPPPPGRADIITPLTEMFGYVRGNILVEDRNFRSAHFDNEGLPARDWVDETALFDGRGIRYLRVWDGPGTLILDEPGSYEIDRFDGSIYVADPDFSKARELRNGDILLFFDAQAGSQLALAHSSPDFERGDGPERVLESIDLGAGKKLAALRAAL